MSEWNYQVADPLYVEPDDIDITGGSILLARSWLLFGAGLLVGVIVGVFAARSAS